ELDQAKAALDQFTAQSQKASTGAARIKVDMAKAELARAQSHLKRIAELADQKLASSSQREQAEAEVVLAESALRLAAAQYEEFIAAQHGRASAPVTPRLDPAAADVARAQMEVAK